jgi:hypothetical protein
MSDSLLHMFFEQKKKVLNLSLVLQVAYLSHFEYVLNDLKLDGCVN